MTGCRPLRTVPLFPRKRDIDPPLRNPVSVVVGQQRDGTNDDSCDLHALTGAEKAGGRAQGPR